MKLFEEFQCKSSGGSPCKEVRNSLLPEYTSPLPRSESTSVQETFSPVTRKKMQGMSETDSLHPVDGRRCLHGMDVDFEL